MGHLLLELKTGLTTKILEKNGRWIQSFVKIRWSCKTLCF